MNIFKSDKAPYVLGLLVTVIGWHVSQIVNEIRSIQAVSYSVGINRKTGDVTALVRNVSRTRSLAGAIFSLECDNGESCFEALDPFEEGETPVYGSVEAIPPHALTRQVRRDSASSIMFTNTVAPDGRYRIVGKLASSHRHAEVNFFYIPIPNRDGRPLDIYVYNRDTLRGVVIENYLGLLGVSLLLCLIFLVITLIQGSRRNTPTEEEATNGA